MALNKILFVGNILSKHKGSKGASEKLIDIFKDEIPIRAVSNKTNILLRFVDIFWVCLTHEYSVLIADTYSGNALTIARIASIVAKFRGKKIVLVLRGGKLPEYYQTNKPLVDSIFKRATQIITPSLYLKSFFEEKSYTIQYLPNFIDNTIFSPQNAERKPYSLLWVRAFKDIYNPWLAVKTLHKTIERFPQATLIMIGPDDGLLADTKKLATDLGIIDKIEFLGAVKNTELPKYYSSHTVYLNTTSYESFGMAVLEAAACGIPIVSTKVGELPLLWQDEKNILLVDGFDESEMAGKVISLFENQKKANAQSIEAQEKAKQFSIGTIKSQWQKLFSLQ